jgi:hypothetical protein
MKTYNFLGRQYFLETRAKIVRDHSKLFFISVVH